MRNAPDIDLKSKDDQHYLEWRCWDGTQITTFTKTFVFYRMLNPTSSHFDGQYPTFRTQDEPIIITHRPYFLGPPGLSIHLNESAH